MLRNEIHERKSLGVRLSGILRRLAVGRTTKYSTMLIDLSCCLDTTGPFNINDLPLEPTGFVVTQTTRLMNPTVHEKLLCEMQVVSMAVMYFRLARRTGDAQDTRSCSRYCTWLEEYLKDQSTYKVVEQEHMESYLYPITDENKPHLPEWLDDGETL